MIKELEQEQFNSVKMLADTSLKISEAKNTLFKLQEEETQYLIEREKKTINTINKTLENSAGLVKTIKDNHEEVRQYSRTITAFADYLKEMYDKFKVLQESFVERNKLWEQNMKRQEEIIAKQRKEVEAEQKLIKLDEEKLKEMREDLEKTKILIESRQTILAASYEEEKKLWNKIK